MHLGIYHNPFLSFDLMHLYIKLAFGVSLQEVLEHLIEDVVSRLVEKGFDLRALDSDIGYQDWFETQLFSL